VDVTYQHIARPVGKAIKGRSFDALLLPYDVLSLRQAPYWDSVFSVLQTYAELADTVVALPQDDYTYSGVLDNSLDALGTSTVFTPIETGLEYVYPILSKKAVLRPALTGYVDEETVTSSSRFRVPMNVRPLHVGQRVRMLPPWFGRGGRDKGLLAERFATKARATSLVIDISTNDSDVFHGDEWYRFLASCRATIGQKGGATMCDPDGSIMRAVMEYTALHPDAPFEEIEAACFPQQDGVATMKAISPRLFDSAMLHTAQILVEDSYLGVLEPWTHYIPTDQQLSNFDEIAQALEDVELLESLTEAADQALLRSGLFTYRSFVQTVCDVVGETGLTSHELVRDDVAGRLQWRLTPELFEALQRVAYLAKASGSVNDITRLADQVRDMIIEDPAISAFLDSDVFELVVGTLDLDRTLMAHLGPIIDVLVECGLAGALGDAVAWMCFIGSTDLAIWQMTDWVDGESLLLVRAGAT
jgi:hypothetical protein